MSDNVREKIRSLDNDTFAKRRGTPSYGVFLEPEKPKVVRKEGSGYLERSTARRETPMSGAAGLKERKAVGSKNAVISENQRGAQAGGVLEERNSQIFRMSRKPKKLYDQKAATIAKNAAKRERAEALRARNGKENTKLLLALILIVALGTGMYITVPQVTKITKVSVHGMINVLEQEVMAALSLSPEINLFNADIQNMKSRILENPKIIEASIRRVFPDSLSIQLTERKAVACVLVTQEIGTKSIAIDEHGVAFAYLDTIITENNIPVLSGIRFERFVPGQALPPYLIPLLGDIAVLSRQAPSLLNAFSEIKIEKISNSEAELLLFPSGKRVPIRMPARLTAAKLGSALLVLDILSSRKGSETVEEIDFRTGTIVYKTKEAQTG
jgi:cell division protein FtsQ